MGTFLLGLESELMLIDASGKIVNRAEEIIAHPLNTGVIVPEYAGSMVELNPLPSSNLHVLNKNLREGLATLQQIAQTLSLSAIPLSDIGPDKTPLRVADKKRYDLYERATGKDSSIADLSACGTHLHIDHQSNIVDQFNLYQSLDPVFAFMSTTHFFMGKNTVNCGRVNYFRNHIFLDAPFMTQLLDYAKTEEDIQNLQELRSGFFLERLGDTPEIRSIFGGYNNGSSPIRKTDKTIEIRCADSNMPSFTMAMAALYKGITEIVCEGELRVKIAPEHGEYGIDSNEITLPSHGTLKEIEYAAIRHGPESQIVHAYLSHIVDIARRGLPEDEQHFLQPFEDVLHTHRNLAKTLGEYIRVISHKKSSTIDSTTAQKTNLFYHFLLGKDLNQESSSRPVSLVFPEYASIHY